MKFKHGKAYYVGFLFPALFAITMVILVPLLYGIYTSFTNSDGYNMSFIGLENYRQLLTDSNFLSSLWLTIRFAFVTVIGVNVIGLGFALLVTRKTNRITTLLEPLFLHQTLLGD